MPRRIRSGWPSGPEKGHPPTKQARRTGPDPASGSGRNHDVTQSESDATVAYCWLMDSTREIYDRLRPPDPTPDEEMCDCPDGAPVKLVGGALFYNPIFCLEWNGEVPPERLELDARLADDLASWLATYRAIDSLELASGEYEMWARQQLMDLDSPPNREGLVLNGRLNGSVRSYFWLWQPQSEDDWRPPGRVPVVQRRAHAARHRPVPPAAMRSRQHRHRRRVSRHSTEPRADTATPVGFCERQSPSSASPTVVFV